MLDIFDKFKKITQSDLRSFFISYNTFVSQHYSNIVNYYNGQDIIKESFDFLDDLVKQTKQLTPTIEIFSNAFDTTEYWDLIDTYTNIVIKLDTINNLGKWLRSSRLDRYNQTISMNYIQKQHESIERISRKFGGQEEDWVQIAISNDLNEESYTSAGGTLLHVRLTNNLNFDIRNIIDYFTQENLYGKDIQNKIEFIDGDIVCLQGESSLMQTVENILSTEKGSIPEFPSDGIDPDLIGSSVSFFNYPVQFRNIVNMIQKDDRFKTFEILDIYQTADQVYLKFNIKTKIGNLIQRELAI